MSKKSSNFFEEHAEKMVLVVIGMVCMWLLVSRIFISPNYIKYDGKKFATGEIDVYISEQAELLADRINRQAKPKNPYEPRLDDFVALMDSAISGIDVSLSPPQPRSTEQVGIKPVYDLPLVNEVSDVEVGHIRAVAYIPVEKVNEDNIYYEAEVEPGDLDIVTAEAKFDVSQLYKSFYESFAGEGVRQEWRDPCLAKPVFATVQMQRQQLLADGRWSNWQVVPQTRINHHAKIFEVVEDVKDLPPGGIKVRLLQFSDIGVVMDLLQPEVYSFASAKTEWFPPSLHKRYVQYQKILEAQERRDAKAAEKEGREESQRAGRTPDIRSRSGYGFEEGGYEEGGGATTTTRRTTRRTRGERERPERAKDVAKSMPAFNARGEFKNILITDRTNLAKMQEPLVIWAHDDTVEAGKIYRYRIKLGVLNPIAGTNRVSERDRQYRDKPVLWSRFSDVTEEIAIPGTLYFFPYEIREATRTVTVQVSKYVLGRWYSKDFMARQGEVIGKVAAPGVKEEKQDVVIPETVDYSTGAILVDVMPVNDWGGGKNLRSRHYFDMFYSFDGMTIENIPVKQRYWSVNLQDKFNEIKKAEKEPMQPWRAWEGQETRPTQQLQMPGMEFPEEGMY